MNEQDPNEIVTKLNYQTENTGTNSNLIIWMIVTEKKIPILGPHDPYEDATGQKNKKKDEN